VLNYNLRTIIADDHGPASPSALQSWDDPKFESIFSTLRDIPMFAYGYPKLIPGEALALAQLLGSHYYRKEGGNDIADDQAAFFSLIEVKHAPVSIPYRLR